MRCIRRDCEGQRAGGGDLRRCRCKASEDLIWFDFPLSLPEMCLWTMACIFVVPF